MGDESGKARPQAEPWSNEGGIPYAQKQDRGQS